MNKISMMFVAFIGWTLSVCGSHPSYPTSKPAENKIANPPAALSEAKDDRKGLSLTLRELFPKSDQTEIAPNADSKILSKEKTRALLNRLPPLVTEKMEDRSSSFPPSLDSPPRPGGAVVAKTFPQTEIPPPISVEAGELRVVRFAPKGPVETAPHLFVSFSKPMVSVTSAEQAMPSPPIEISPPPKGKWRALGTQTFLFSPETRFPMASKYRVTIPKGLQSEGGDRLKSAFSFTFQTPPLIIEDSYPNSAEPQPLTPPIFVRFNQKIDPTEVMKSISLFSDETEVETVPISMVELPRRTPDGTDLRARAEAAVPGTWIAFRPVKPLDNDSQIRVVLNKGAKSAEGPLETPKPQEFGFHTFAPFKMEKHRCERGDGCPPPSAFDIEFNNPLDLDAFDRKSIRVEPNLPGVKVDAWHRTIRILGAKDGNTTYKVTVAAEVKDTFGQTLGRDETVTFEVGPAAKTLYPFDKEIVTLDPTGSPILPIFSTELEALHLEIYRTEPSDLRKAQELYVKKTKSRNRNAKGARLPGTKILDQTVPVSGPKGGLNQTPVDLTPYLKDGFGQFIVRVRPGKKDEIPELDKDGMTVWVQVTHIGVTAFVDQSELVVWASALDRAAPVKNAEVALLGRKGDFKATSDSNGLSRFELPEASKPGDLLVVKSGSDVALLPYNEALRWTDTESGWRKIEVKDELRWFTFDDRHLYRPGETASIKGWMRRMDSEKTGDIHPLSPRPTKVRWHMFDSLGNEVSSGDTEVSELGGFDLSLPLPENMNLGNADLSLTASFADTENPRNLQGFEHRLRIQVEEFRRPEFEVTSTSDAGPFVVGDEAKVTVSASYYSGGGLPMAKVTWTALAAPAFYSPPGYDGFSFGPWNPWWFAFSKVPDTTTRKTLFGETDGSGMHRIGISFDAVNPARPMSVRVEGQVTDVNQQRWTDSQTLLVHPSNRYVGIRLKKGFVGRNEPVFASIIVADIDGKNIVGATPKITLSRVEYSYRNNRFKETFVDESVCEASTSNKPFECRFTPSGPGVFRLLGEISDDKGRRNVTETRVWVEGAKAPRSDVVGMEKAVLVPEKQVVQPGETASFMVQAPFVPAEGVLTVRSFGLVETRSFHMDEPTTVLTVAVQESFTPGFSVQADLTGVRRAEGVENGASRRPVFASGRLEFQVPPLKRTLKVTVSAKDKVLHPGKETTIDVQVKDANGKPMEGAELAILAVDESVLALSGYPLPDPISVFYRAKGDRTESIYSRNQVTLFESPPENGGSPTFWSTLPLPSSLDARMYNKQKSAVYKVRSAPLTTKTSTSQESPKIASRADFEATALFAPHVTTDKSGRATVPLLLPDSLTRYRIMAVAAAEDKFFGASQTNITARLPLMVRPSPPRFLSFGDSFELPVVIENRTDKPVTTEVTVRASNATLSKAGETEAGKAVTVPPDNRVEVRFYASPKNAGTARFQIAAASADFLDAQTIALPVNPPAAAETFATYGEIDDKAVLQSVQAPKEAWKAFGGLELSISSTELQSLTGAVLSLATYPFECAEQISSRILAVSALSEVLSAFSAESLPSPKALRKSVSDDLSILGKFQNWDGGFGFWMRRETSLPYLTVHAAHAMAEAKAKGFAVDPSMWDRTFAYLKNIKTRLPSWYSKETKQFIRGYAIYAMEKMGGDSTSQALDSVAEVDFQKVNDIHRLIKTAAVITAIPTDESPLSQALDLVSEAGDKLPLEASAWMLPTLNRAKKTEMISSILRRLDNAATETAGGAHFVTSYTDGAQVLLHSDRRADAVLLDALIAVTPTSDLIPKIARGLLGRTVKGSLRSTQENAFVLLALAHYFNVFENTAPDFTAAAWLKDKLVLEHPFKGRTTERAYVDIPMDKAFENASRSDIVIDKKGQGRLYYRLGLRYAPKRLNLKPVDYGFTVDRVYEGVDAQDDVIRDKNGAWHIRRGSRVRVRLSLFTPSRRYHAALADPLPAGLEPVNPTLAVEGTIPDDPKAQKRPYWWWYRPWFDHQNLRDDRIEAFASLLREGVHEYSYIARATTPGIFVAPPARVEEMYHPETFGRTGTDKIIVE